MLSISNLSFHIGARTIFDEASLHIKPKDKIGLIGLNGTGKSTLLKLINGEITPDGGTVSRSRDCSIGFLNQDQLSYQSEESILSVAMQAFEEETKLERKIETLLKKMEVDHSDSLITELSKTQEKYEAMGGYTLQSKAEEILEGIGFATADLHRPMNEFSGGWRMRVMLAKLLLENPSLLMLDEPTNHLDLPSIMWVESYLKNYPGAVIVVSHDKQFLDNTITNIIEVDQKKLNLYQGNYSFYETEKSLRSEIQQNAYINQQQHIKQSERFIERFRAKATKARQVQSRVKALEKLNKIEAVADKNAQVNFKFKPAKQSGRHVSTVKHLTKRYGDNIVLEDTSIGIERGDKIALIGANGIGKSTMLRIIGTTEACEGKSELGYNVDISFYAQHQIDSLNLNHEVLEELKYCTTEKTEQELRNILGNFLFSDDDVFKKIKVLSGGERSRVALAKTLISEANFLILDEPTNHLDIQSVNILSQALQQYAGTIILVSHDRQFISEVANKIWYIEEKKVKEYPGTLDEYIYWKNRKDSENKKPPTRSAKVKKDSNKNRGETNSTRKHKRRIIELKKQLESCENTIMMLEEKSADCEDLLSKPEVYSNMDRLAEVNTEFEKINKDLVHHQKQWEEFVDEINKLEEEQ
jgi:ATP-binding cassette subfamily F protein 3